MHLTHIDKFNILIYLTNTCSTKIKIVCDYSALLFLQSPPKEFCKLLVVFVMWPPSPLPLLDHPVLHQLPQAPVLPRRVWSSACGSSGRELDAAAGTSAADCDSVCLQVCACDDIVDELGPLRVTKTVQHLVGLPPITQTDQLVACLGLLFFFLTSFLLFLFPLPE